MVLGLAVDAQVVSVSSKPGKTLGMELGGRFETVTSELSCDCNGEAVSKTCLSLQQPKSFVI